MRKQLDRWSRAALHRVAEVAGGLRPHWSPDVAWRYLPMARLVRREVGARGTILDVGAGGRGIGAYLQNRCFTTDLSFPIARGARFVRARAERLPFPDGSFDAVVQADVLEHLPPALRPVVIDEMFRVARRLVVVAAPAGREAAEHDRRLEREANPDNHLRRFLAEHFEFGLPSAEELSAWVRTAAARRFVRPEVRARKNANLRLRHLVMGSLFRVPDPEIEDRIRLWAPLSPALASVRFGPCYRWIVACRDASVAPVTR